MARIESDGISGFRRELRSTRGGEKRPEKTADRFETLFERSIEQQEQLPPHTGARVDLEAVHEQLDQIHRLGERLSKEQTWSVLQEYREAVRAFLRSVAAGATDVEEHVSGTNILNRKRFTLIRTVDQKLERLAAGMLQTQQSQIELLRRVEEIQGLLVDLFH